VRRADVLYKSFNQQESETNRGVKSLTLQICDRSKCEDNDQYLDPKSIERNEAMSVSIASLNPKKK